MKTKRRASRIGIALGVLLVLAIGGFVGWKLLIRTFTHQYYRDSYGPVELTMGILDDVPDACQLADVPWIAASFGVCQSTSLQMIAAQHGSVQPRAAFDFLMGFTYGATQLPGAGLSPYGTDPELGAKTAAPFVGLARRYYVTDEEELYLGALLTFLARGYPVRVALDMGALYGVDTFLAHSVVLVGYDAGGFRYYETVCTAPADCDPGERAPGHPGIRVDDETLLAAVENQSKPLSYPWRYALTVFESGPGAQDLAPVWAQNAAAQLGGNQYGPKAGADAIEAMADRVAKLASDLDADELIPCLETAVITRPDNADYLRAAFPDESDLASAAEHLDEAAEAYRRALAVAEDGIADQGEADLVAGLLRQAVASERQVGEIFAARAGVQADD